MVEPHRPGIVALMDSGRMSQLNFRDLRETLNGLSLHEVDFSVGDAFVRRLRDMRVAVEQLASGEEPWVTDWLVSEHVKAGMLWAAAKTNWAKEQSDGRGRTFSAESRASLIARFNGWVGDLNQRLDSYEVSDRSPSAVAPWIAELKRFRDDPTHNP